MAQDNSHSVLLALPPDVYDSLRHYGEELEVSVHFVSKELLLQAFEQWRVGKFDLTVKPTPLANHRYRSGRSLRETIRKRKEGQQG